MFEGYEIRLVWLNVEPAQQILLQRYWLQLLESQFHHQTTNSCPNCNHWGFTYSLTKQLWLSGGGGFSGQQDTNPLKTYLLRICHSGVPPLPLRGFLWNKNWQSSIKRLGITHQWHLEICIPHQWHTWLGLGWNIFSYMPPLHRIFK